MPVLRVAAEVWLNVAEMEKDNPGESFAPKDIINHIRANNYYKSFRPGIVTHISQHCVADKPPNPGRYAYLASDGDGGRKDRRRLYRDNDVIDENRDKFLRIPDLSEIPLVDGLHAKMKEMIVWWGDQEGVTLVERPKDWGSIEHSMAVRNNQILLAGDIYPFLVDEGQYDLIKEIKAKRIMRQTLPSGNHDDRFRNRPASVKVGFAINRIRKLGLIHNFEVYLNKSGGRTIRDRYEEWFEQYKELTDGIDTSMESPPIPSEQEVVNDPSVSVTDNHVFIKLEAHVCQFLFDQGYHECAGNIREFDVPVGVDPRFSDRSVTVKIGHGIARIKALGLLEEFEFYIGGPVHSRYVQAYDDFVAHTGP